MRSSITTSLLALATLTAGGVASAMPDQLPEEPNIPPPSQPGSPPISPMPAPVPTTPAPQLPAVPSTPDTPQTPQGPTPTTPAPDPTSAPPDPVPPTTAAPEPAPTVEVVPYEEGYPSHYALYRPHLATDIGVAVTVGGGLSGFTDRAMRQTMSSDVGGLWDMHVAFGTHLPIGLELGYIGTAGDIQSLAGTPNGTLVGTAVESDLRWTIVPHRAWTPFVFAGIGWQHYATVDATLSRADTGMKASDDVAEFPLGAGFSFRDVGGFTFDVRGTFRPSTSSTLLYDPRTNSYADLFSWEASAAMGYEF